MFDRVSLGTTARRAERHWNASEHRHLPTSGPVNSPRTPSASHSAPGAPRPVHRKPSGSDPTFGWVPYQEPWVLAVIAAGSRSRPRRARPRKTRPRRRPVTGRHAGQLEAGRERRSKPRPSRRIPGPDPGALVDFQVAVALAGRQLQQDVGATCPLDPYWSSRESTNGRTSTQTHGSPFRTPATQPYRAVQQGAVSRLNVY